MRARFLVPLLVGALLTTGCTIRYSQSLASAMPQTDGREVRSNDTGFSLLNITLSEPDSAHDQVRALIGACSRLTKVQVDYRELSFVLFGIPKVSVKGICEQ
ncbi:MAG: hypothetical protein JSU66_13330 [Deltaproteobacteria bacterium]|nr:MAG: hypothetical protein JSU66_13330 [Deltaproteobacteria bacterium]